MTALAVLASGSVLVAGCGASDDQADADRSTASVATSSIARAPERAATGKPSKWVSIEDCEVVEEILATVEAGRLPDIREQLVSLRLERSSKIRLTEDGLLAWLGGSGIGNGTCTFD